MRILLTSTSFQDTPGKHQELLKATGFEVDTLRGPVKKEALLPIISQYDGIICGDDEYTKEVIAEGKKGKLKVISKYGIGLDKIDLVAAKELNIPVTNCPGVNHTTVAEHVFALLLSFVKHIPQELAHTKNGEWTRYTGNEIYGKTMGIIGLGKIGKEVAIRAQAFGLRTIAYDQYWDENFADKFQINRCDTPEELFANCDIISLHTDLNKDTRNIISSKRIKENMKQDCILINTARGELVEMEGLLWALKEKKIKGYLTDVLEEEPMKQDHPLRKYDNVFITPHIGSRTFESVERQGTMAVENLLQHLNKR
jgi:D-3-phosphoglycerate dehydrogenase